MYSRVLSIFEPSCTEHIIFFILYISVSNVLIPALKYDIILYNESNREERADLIIMQNSGKISLTKDGLALLYQIQDAKITRSFVRNGQKAYAFSGKTSSGFYLKETGGPI